MVFSWHLGWAAGSQMALLLNLLSKKGRLDLLRREEGKTETVDQRTNQEPFHHQHGSSGLLKTRSASCQFLPQSLGLDWHSITSTIYMYMIDHILRGFPGGSVGKKSSCTVEDMSSIPELGRSSWRSECQPTPVFLPGESHGLRSLAGYSP